MARVVEYAIKKDVKGNISAIEAVDLLNGMESDKAAEDYFWGKLDPTVRNRIDYSTKVVTYRS